MFLLGQTIYYLDPDSDQYVVGQITGENPENDGPGFSVVIHGPFGGYHIPDVAPGKPGEAGKFLSARQYLESQLGLKGDRLADAREAFFGSESA